MHSWNLEKIYQTLVESKGSITVPRLVVKEYLSKSDVKKAIISNNPDVKLGSDKRGSIRIQPKQKIEDREEFTKRFIETLDDINLVVVDVLNPGDPKSPSSKYLSYVVKDPSNNEFIITLGGGAFSNKGMDYERYLLKILQQYFDNAETQEKPEFLEKLENYLEVTFTGLDEGTSFERNVKRPLSDKGPDDMGKEISDVTLIDEKGDKYFISLKNVSGKTISNNGAKGMFEIKDDKVEFTNKEKNEIGRKLMEAGGVNIDRAVQGLSDYVNEEQSQAGQEDKVNTTDIADIKKLEKFIGSGFDYGYIYVKQKNKKGDIEVVDLTDSDKLYDFIGDIKSVEVKYPYYRSKRDSRKHISIIISTEGGIYSFDIRNASGGVIPNQINLVRGGSPQEIKSLKSNIEAISRREKDLSNSLSDI